MKLVLVESPTKAKKLSGYLGADFVVRASVGHIRDLPKSKMGVDVDHGFKPEYLVPKDKKKVVKELQEIAKRASSIILATDPDREGEAIGWHLREILSEEVKSTVPFVRSSFHEITKAAVMEAIDNPTVLNMALVEAQQARRILDRLVGYSVSPVLWKKIRYGLSAGRVQSVALRFIVEREREIEAFIPEEYWEVDVLVSLENSAGKNIDSQWKTGKTEDIPLGTYVGRVAMVNGKTFTPTKAEDVGDLPKFFETARYSVAEVEKKERRRAAPPPFTTSTLQQQSATRLGYTSKNTMRLAQQLYEEGLITYHRTDSLNIGFPAIEMARSYLKKVAGNEYVPEKPNYFSTKSKNAQEAHEAVRPTDAGLDPDKFRRQIAGRMTEQHAKLYDLIWRRFIASQMTPAVYDQTTITTMALAVDASSQMKDAKLKTSGSTLKFDGWMKFFPNQGDVILPSVTPQQSVYYSDHSSVQKFTQPPPRYNDASLIKTLEQEGIGRPSTYASIISVIDERGYIERKEKKFFPTMIGMAVNDFLVKHFKEIVDFQFTAKMEDDLDAIARGEKSWQEIVQLFYQPLKKDVDEASENAERSQIPTEKTGLSCPKCGATEHGEVVIRTGRFGKFLSCNRFPECDYTEAIVNKIEGVKCPLCQEGDVVIKPSRYGKDFYSCTRYPECNWASWSKPTPDLRITAPEWAKMQAERLERQKARAERLEASGKTAAGKPAKRTKAKVKSKRQPSKKA